VAVGIAGVALWPLYFSGTISFYPGMSHARLMAYGFFGGFIVGFLGTAFPRMLGAAPLQPFETAVLLVLYVAMVAVILAAKTTLGDGLFVLLLLVLAAMLGGRARKRADVPPPGFVLVGLALLCAAVGAVLSILQNYSETAFFWGALQHLLVYQGLMLLPILGVGAFLFPRFLGLGSQHSFPESITPPPGWTGKALAALLTGGLIIVSFWLEAAGWVRAGPGLRFAVTLIYLVREVPIYRSGTARNAPAGILKLALGLLLAGFAAIVFLPGYRISLLHLTLIGGFAMITLAVATRVTFGHSGNLVLLDRPNRLLWVSTGIMLLAMVTRISGDFWTKVLASHYSYGAVVWIVAILLWSFYVLPKVAVPDPAD
jgi:uncharacterized protein involved in response to NO